ncbi:MAG: membrane protein [Candidatus Nitrosocaldaceae archaeon]|nr:MAG: membrane protein [Candidatus Nitrosocaldaceae archaeon]
MKIFLLYIEMENNKNLLVICIDRDDDIGSKGGIKTPVIGRDSCINAGVNLAVMDPEEADANAIFAAVRTYEELISKGYRSEVALLSGSYKGGVEADQKIAYQLQDVLQRFKADGAIIVSDGGEDELVLPVIQNIIPVVSVQRVVIKHSRSVEYSYAILARYLKTLVFDPRYSKFFLGVPGALLIAGALAFLLDLGRFAAPVIAGILGAALIIRGFDIDKALKNLTKISSPSSYIRIFSLSAGILIILASLQSGYSNAIKFIDESMDILNLEIVGHFAYGMLPLLWAGLGTIFGGRMLSSIFKERFTLHTLGDMLRLIVLALFYVPVQQFILMLTGDVSNPFTLVSSLLIGLAVTLVAASLVYKYYIVKRKEHE